MVQGARKDLTSTEISNIFKVIVTHMDPTLFKWITDKSILEEQIGVLTGLSW